MVVRTIHISDDMLKLLSEAVNRCKLSFNKTDQEKMEAFCGCVDLVVDTPEDRHMSYGFEI